MISDEQLLRELLIERRARQSAETRLADCQRELADTRRVLGKVSEQMNALLDAARPRWTACAYTHPEYGRCCFGADHSVRYHFCDGRRINTENNSVTNIATPIAVLNPSGAHADLGDD